MALIEPLGAHLGYADVQGEALGEDRLKVFENQSSDALLLHRRRNMKLVQVAARMGDHKEPNHLVAGDHHGARLWGGEFGFHSPQPVLSGLEASLLRIGRSPGLSP